MPRPRTIAIGAFALLLAASPFVPRGGGDDGALRPSGEKRAALLPADAVGYGAVTPDLQREIDRVVQQGLVRGRVSAKQTPEQLAADLVRCADFAGQRYCLHSGWTTSDPAQVRARIGNRRPNHRGATGLRTTSTGDLDSSATLRRTAGLDPSARAEAERARADPGRALGGQGVAAAPRDRGVEIPAAFLDQHPEARAHHAPPGAPTTAAAGRRRGPRPPGTTRSAAEILSTRRVAEQERTYWCGPTTMQMIAWGWKKRRQAARTTGRTGSAPPRAAPRSPTWSASSTRAPAGTARPRRAVHHARHRRLQLRQWKLLLMRHIVDYKAPLVLHPILLQEVLPVPRRRRLRALPGRTRLRQERQPARCTIGYFEPWNQQRFDPSEPYIDRVQWRQAYKSYRANQAHFQHNIGV